MQVKKNKDKFKDAVEVACEPSRFDCENEFYGVGIFMCALSIWAVGLVFTLIIGIAVGIPVYSILGSFGFLTLCLVALALLVYGIFYCLAARELTMLGRMRRLLSMFNHIETLVLHNAGKQDHIICASLTSLRRVKINRLEVRSHTVDYFFRFVYFFIP